MAASKKRPVTLADLRKAAPKGWKVYAGGVYVLAGELYPRRDRVFVRHARAQTARRAALAALNAMGKEARRGSK